MPRSFASLSGLFFNTDSSKTTGVAISGIGALQNLTAVTIDAWVYPTSYPIVNLSKIFSYTSGVVGYQLYIGTTGLLNISVGNGTSNPTKASTNPIPLNTWTHVSGMWDGSNLSLFINGVQTIGNALSGGSTGVPGLSPWIGNQSAGTRAFSGTISEVRISNTARYSGNFTPPVTPYNTDINTIGLYHLNEGQGTVANDSSSNANHGTLSGSPLPVWSNGKFLGGNTSRTVGVQRQSTQNFPASLSFNGLTSNVVLTQNSGLPIFSQSGYSVYGKFKNFVGPTVQALYAEGNTGSNNQLFSISLNQIGTTPIVTVRNNANVAQVNAVTGNTRLIMNTWHDFLWVDNNGVCTLYIDGVADTNSAFSYTPAGPYTFNTSAIGEVNRGTPVNFYKGMLSDFRLFSTALNPVQAAILHQSGINPVNPVAQLPLTEGTGTTALDISSNGNNGTVTNGTYTSDVPSKVRTSVGDNLVYNGNFEYAPPFTAATTAINVFIDGTVTGSVSNAIFGWYYISNTSAGTSNVAFDSTQAHSGNYSLRLSSTASTGSATVAMSATSPAGTRTNIPVTPGVSYIASVWIKTNVISGTSTTGVNALIRQSDAAGTNQGSTNIVTGINTTTGWTRYSVVFTAAANARVVSPRFLITNDGAATLIADAWFDDVSIVPVVPTTRNLVP